MLEKHTTIRNHHLKNCLKVIVLSEILGVELHQFSQVQSPDIFHCAFNLKNESQYNLSQISFFPRPLAKSFPDLLQSLYIT